jgi:hypothetical protein
MTKKERELAAWLEGIATNKWELTEPEYNARAELISKARLLGCVGFGSGDSRLTVIKAPPDLQFVCNGQTLLGFGQSYVTMLKEFDKGFETLTLAAAVLQSLVRPVKNEPGLGGHNYDLDDYLE